MPTPHQAYVTKYYELLVIQLRALVTEIDTFEDGGSEEDMAARDHALLLIAYVRDHVL